MSKVKVRAVEYGDKMDFVLPDYENAGILMELLSTTHVPHEQYKGELYPIRFEVETIPDPEDEMTEEEFNDLQDLLDDPVIEDLPIEDVEEAVAEDVAKEVE